MMTYLIYAKHRTKLFERLRSLLHCRRYAISCAPAYLGQRQLYMGLANLRPI